MKLYFNFKTNSIVAKTELGTIDMRNGELTNLTCDARLDSYAHFTKSKWIEMPKISENIKGISIVRNGNKVQFSGFFPRYFWKGLVKYLEKYEKI